MSWEGGISKREGNATFTDGAVAAVASRARARPRPSYKGRIVITVPDGSTITARYGLTDKFDLDYMQSGAGDFVSGTGRLQGITGKYPFQGKRGDTEHVGTYALPRK